MHLNAIYQHCSCSMMSLILLREEDANITQYCSIDTVNETEMDQPNSIDRLRNHRERHRSTWVSHILHEVISGHLVANSAWHTFNHG